MSIARYGVDEALPEHMRGAIIALGNFDGFHRGHQAVAGEAIGWARAEGRPAIVATFDPHPARLFQPNAPPFRLTTLDQRQQLFADAGADAMLVFAFDRALAATSAQDFVRELLIGRLGAAAVVTGGDFTFGKGRAGKAPMLGTLGADLGFRSRIVAPIEGDGGIISSTRIREALKAGDPREAARLLSRPFAIEGRVVHGAKTGRELGYPTANLELGHYLRPRYGIYAVRGRLPDGRVLDGAANIGIRPSFDPPVELLEPYFFQFSGDLYGQNIAVELHDFLRPERKFDDLEALKVQMAADCHEARHRLASVPAG
ncbi:bifunctional riboflavin kinase/FAD synthetase [Novosphingopyxis sp.]|uniref:bifunctional riboflavin kinase/FAD synthetase n=1 Tax=Novosphingopyxis sp. TaxID=2709690 RepID=UPI003B5C6977